MHFLQHYDGNPIWNESKFANLSTINSVVSSKTCHYYTPGICNNVELWERKMWPDHHYFIYVVLLLFFQRRNCISNAYSLCLRNNHMPSKASENNGLLWRKRERDRGGGACPIEAQDVKSPLAKFPTTTAAVQIDPANTVTPSNGVAKYKLSFVKNIMFLQPAARPSKCSCHNLVNAILPFLQIFSSP